MRILQLTTHLNIGGIGAYVANLSNALKAKDHTVFAASSGGELEESLCKTGITHFRIDIKTKSELSPKVIKSFFAVKGIVERENIELIHAHTRVTAVSAALVSRAMGVPYVTTCHGFFKRRLGRALFGSWGRKVIAISDAVKKHLIGDFKLPEDRVELIYTGIDVNKFSGNVPDGRKEEIRQAFGLSGRPIIIGNIGRLSPVKGQAFLIMASKKILADFPDARVLLIGSGPDEKRLKALAAELGIGDKVIFTGNAPDTKDVLSIMDLFVLPSVKEGLGLSLLEAMACGVPCAASDIGGVKDVIEDGVNGLLFIAEDADDLSRAVKKMLIDESLRALTAKNGREKVLRDFTLDKMAVRIEQLYREVIDKGR